MNDRPLPRDIWYTEVFDGHGNSHIILIDRTITRRLDMAKVEELRKKAEKLKNELTRALSMALLMALGSNCRHNTLVKDINELTTAFLEQGVAEGAEQMANQIRFHGGHYTQKGDLVMSEYISPGLAGRAVVDLFIVPASVLAPKEKT